MLVHSVFFWLKSDLTAAQRAEFDRLLAALEGVKSAEKIYIGVPAATGDRPVIDRSYTVALTVLFKDVAAHDAYQVDPLHQAFLTACRSYWSKVQIYDPA
jgi:hypothetical protein